MSPQGKANSANNLIQMLFACYLWSFTVPYNFNNVANKSLQNKIACRERLWCKVWRRLWEYSLLQHTPAWLWASIQQGCLHRPEPHLHWPSPRNMDLVTKTNLTAGTRERSRFGHQKQWLENMDGENTKLVCVMSSSFVFWSLSLIYRNSDREILTALTSCSFKRSTQYNSVILMWSFILRTNSAQCIYAMDLCI